MPDGIRKTGKISSLKNLNERLNLGMSNKEIESMSTGELQRTIYKIKLKHNLKIQAHCKKFEVS